MTNAVVFVLGNRLILDGNICLQYCLAHGYNMIGVVKDDWRQALDYLHDGTAAVLVVADERSFADQSPRIEVVAHAGTRTPNGNPKAAGRRNERTHLVRRTAAE
jgi:hypothetical protein